MINNSSNNCQKAIDLLISQMEETHFSPADLDKLCAQYPTCTNTLRTTFETWQALEEIEVPAPSQEMHANFYKTLVELTAEEQNKAASKSQNWSTFYSLFFRWGPVLGVFVLGLVISPYLFSSKQPTAELTQENLNVKPGFSQLISSTSTIERLQGVQEIKSLERLDVMTIEVLYETLISDKNINVRLAAIETMLFFQENPKVRESLIKAIPYQDAPLVQLTLAEVILALKDKRAIKEIQELLNSREVELDVKIQLESAIEQLL